MSISITVCLLIWHEIPLTVVNHYSQGTTVVSDLILQVYASYSSLQAAQT
jgi:hypothetical protein